MDKHVLLIGLFTIAGAVYLSTCTPAHPEPPGGVQYCQPPDEWDIRDDGPGRAIVTYYNSEAGCSMNVDTVLTSENGVMARIVIIANPADANGDERFDVIPEDPNMMAYPPSLDVSDGEAKEIVIQGGLS